MKNIRGICPLCNAHIVLPAESQETEAVSCPECKKKLIIKTIENDLAVLEKARDVEEYWGEQSTFNMIEELL